MHFFYVSIKKLIILFIKDEGTSESTYEVDSVLFESGVPALFAARSLIGILSADSGSLTVVDVFVGADKITGAADSDAVVTVSVTYGDNDEVWGDTADNLLGT